MKNYSKQVHRKGQRYLAGRISFLCSISNKVVVGYKPRLDLLDLEFRYSVVEALLKAKCACRTSLYGRLYKQSFIHWHYPNTRVVGLCLLFSLFMCYPQANEVLCKTIPEACEFGLALFYGKNGHILIIKIEQK
jgi:hypothetical protein